MKTEPALSDGPRPTVRPGSLARMPRAAKVVLGLALLAIGTIGLIGTIEALTGSSTSGTAAPTVASVNAAVQRILGQLAGPGQVSCALPGTWAAGQKFSCTVYDSPAQVSVFGTEYCVIESPSLSSPRWGCRFSLA